ncbi:MAG: hypothetical protein GX557_09310, partial [Chloroflexi bacterium]|nr:hypothetical protein [Chloroflexota bacterium]
MKTNAGVIAYRVLSVLVLLAVLVNAAACGRGAPTPTPVGPLGGVTATQAVPTEQPQVTVEPMNTQPPIVTPEPSITPTPLPPQPPRVLGRSPERGEELAAEGAIVLRFDQPMDTTSVEQALTIEPAIEGTLAWDDPGVARFVPSGAFERDTLYRVSLSTDAGSAVGLKMAAPVEFAVRTVGFLEVTNVSPSADATDVPTNSVIRVIFNRPVVPLTSVNEQQALITPIKIEPPLEGTGRWTNTSIYTFEPSEALAAGTLYTVTVADGLADTTGGLLAGAYVWSFTTQVPGVVMTQPYDGEQYVSPKTSFEITFNQPMQPVETQMRFALAKQGMPGTVRGSYSWRTEDVGAHVLVFTPNQPLEPGQTYAVRLASGAPASTGSATIADSYAWTFTVAGVPEVVSYSPKSGSLGVDPGRGIVISFSSPISEPTFLDGLVISPTTTLYPWWEDDGRVVNLNTYLKPSTKYTVSVTDKVHGLYGGALTNPVSFEFTTAPLEPSVWLGVPGSFGTYNAYGEPTIRAQFRNVSRIGLAVYRMPAEDFVALNRDGNWDGLSKYTPARDALVRSWSVPVSAELNALGTYAATLTAAGKLGEDLPAGFYYLTLASPDARSVASHVLLISEMNVTLKYTNDAALAWVTDLMSGRPLPGVEVSFYAGDGQLAAKAQTDGDGVAQATLGERDPWSALIVLAKRTGDDGVARYGAALSTWSSGRYPYEFGLQGSPYQEEYRAHLYTERQMYRPGQTV